MVPGGRANRRFLLARGRGRCYDSAQSLSKALRAHPGAQPGARFHLSETHPARNHRSVGFIGGTGPEGRGLAVRFAAAGHDVVIGSRDDTRAAAAAAEVRAILIGADIAGAADVRGALNAEAASESEIVFLAVPYGGMIASLEQLVPALAGAVCVNVIAPLSFEGGVPASAPPEIGSAAEEAARYAPDLRWVAGLHTLSARDLLDPTVSLDTDAIICGDDDDAKTIVSRLLSKIPGLRPVDAGPLQSARYLEGATALLLNINRRYRAHASLRVAGLHIN